MESEEFGALHRHNEYVHEAIRDCVHDLASRHCADKTRRRAESQLRQVSHQMTEQARLHDGTQTDPPAA